MMPFWLWLLSGYFVSEGSVVKVPFLDIALSLIFLTLPLGIGLLIRHYKPDVAQFITAKCIKPFSLFVPIFTFAVSWSVSVILISSVDITSFFI